MQDEKINDVTNTDVNETDGIVKLPGTRKAAIFLMTLGDKISGQIFKNLSVIEQEKILVEIASPSPVSPEIRAGIIDEFYTLMQTQGIYAGGGGWAKVHGLLSSAFGGKSGQAKELEDRLQAAMSKQPFNLFRDVEPGRLYGFIRNESSQTIALVLSYLPSDQAAEVLSQFKRSEKRNEIARRIATMISLDRHTVTQVEDVLKKKIVRGPGTQWSREGPETLAQMLNKSSPDITDLALEYIQNRGADGPEIAQKVKDKMFTFQDIIQLNDVDVGVRVMMDVDDKEIATALRGENDEIINKFRRNTPDRRWERIESLMTGRGIARSLINEAQRNIVEKIRDMETAGEITITRTGEELVE